MRRTFNYTNRKKLFYKGANPDFKIKLEDQSNFDTKVQLNFINFKKIKSFGEDCSVTFEAFNAEMFEHFHCGLIKDLNNQISFDIHSGRETLRFRLKVVSNTGKIIAMAKNINPDSRTQLFAIQEAHIDEVWRTDIETNDKPIVYVNKDLNIYKFLHRTATYKYLIFPKVFQEILRNYLISGRVEEKDIWANHWMRWANKFVSREDYPKKYFIEENNDEAEFWLREFDENYCNFIGKKLDLIKILEKEQKEGIK